jgi:hypothetical protein
LLSLFQDEEKQEVPFVRKRKQPSTSTSQPSEGGPSAQKVEEDEAAKAKKKKKVEEPKTQQTPTKDQGGERRKKKKHEEKKAASAVKVKSIAKRPKVHRVLKIHTSSESDGNPTPQKDASEKDVVEQDHTTKTAPQPGTLVNDQPINDEGQQDDMQPNKDALNAEEHGNPTTDPEVEAKEVDSTLLSNFKFLMLPFDLY